MKNEAQELKAMQAWELVARQPGMKVVPGLWRYRIKKDEGGDIQKHKARWVMDGSREPFTRPPETIYLPIAEMATIRTLFALAAVSRHQVLQADFRNAYLNAEMTEKIYTEQPYGLEEYGEEDKACLLKKALYGCSISGKRWNDAISRAIESLKYKRSTIDHSLYIRYEGGHMNTLVLYVDDILAFSTEGKEKAELQLDEQGEIYKIKKLDTAKHILGIGPHQQRSGITLKQSAYLESTLAEANYLEAKPRSTPWDQHMKDPETVGITEVTIYRRTLGQLIYLSTATRPDIAFVVSMLSAAMSTTPTKGTWSRLKRVVKYLNGTRYLGIAYFKCKQNLHMDTYVDSSFGTDHKKGKSIIGYVTQLAGGPKCGRATCRAP